MREWRDVVGYEGYYQVSNDGIVKGKAGFLAPFIDKDGYARQTLTVKCKKKTLKVHRMVLSAFVGDGTGMEADHLNGIKHDNRLENLEWVTAETNNHRKVIRIFGVLKSVDKRGKKRGQLKLAI